MCSKPYIYTDLDMYKYVKLGFIKKKYNSLHMYIASDLAGITMDYSVLWHLMGKAF